MSTALGTFVCWLIGVLAVAGITFGVSKSGIDREDRVGILVTGIVFLGTGGLIVSRYSKGDPMFAFLGGGFYLASSAFLAWLSFRAPKPAQTARGADPIER